MMTDQQLSRDQLTNYLNSLLKPENYDDYGPNGLQIEGKTAISKIAFAVSATQDSIQKAILEKADALVVHHGLFWKFHGPRTITGPFAQRIKPIIENNLNLFGYHLPLDGHLEVGNAASLADKLVMKNVKPFGEGKMRGSYTGVKGELNLSVQDLEVALSKILNHTVMTSTLNKKAVIKSLGIITGGANSEWKLALKEGLDAYLTGEMSEHDWHEAKESGMTMFAGGHHATEQFGIQSLMKKVQEHFKINCVYIDSENPA
ncbi:MAG: Nif3-like dinuclear metal center hexameric protein [Bacteriovoracaceae bacterium]